MNGINKIFLAGNIVKKPALHKNKNGKTFSFLKMATNRFSYNQGNWDKRTDWHSILVWGKKAELCERFLDKGTPLAVEGFLDNSQDKQIMVVAEDVHFLGVRTSQSSEVSSSTAAALPDNSEEPWDEEDEDGTESTYLSQKEPLPF